MDRLIEVAGIIFGSVFVAMGAIWDWLFGRGIQEPMSVLQGVGAIATAIAVWGAYLQYRDKRYGLSYGEWDILKALQKFRFNLQMDKVDEVEVYLDTDEFHARLNEYPRSCGRPEQTGSLLLKAQKVGETHAGSSPPEAVPSNLLVSARYRRYCRSLEDREYLCRIGETKNIEKYELTGAGERFMQKKWKSIEERYFLGTFVNEVEIMEMDIRSWHKLRPGAVVPEFPGCRSEISGGVEFPDSTYEEDNPCGVRYLLLSRKDQVDVDELGKKLGHAVRLRVEKPTIHLPPDSERILLAGLKYFRVSDIWVEMWFGNPMFVSGGSSLEEEQRKIEERHYRNGYLELPQPYWKRTRTDEVKEHRRRRREWLLHRHENRLDRYRRRLSEAPSRLWNRLRRLAKRDKTD